MASAVPDRPGYLTLTEILINYALYGGVGYLAAGRTGVGVGVGAGLFTAVLVGSGVVAAMRGSRDRGPGGPPDA